MDKEIWRPVKGYENLYEVSNHGNVRSLDRVVVQGNRHGTQSIREYKGKLLKAQSFKKTGYKYVNLAKNGRFERFTIHRLVAIAFIDKPEGLDVINHIDSNPTNNHVSNLEWCTQSYNVQYSYDTGRKAPPHQKKIGQYDMEGNLIRTWESISEAKRTVPHCKNITKVLSGERIQSGGYKWKYIQ